MDDNDISPLQAIEAGLPEGDPRRIPFTADEERTAKHYMRDPLRWHRTTRVDWLAVRLQHGRGLSVQEVAHMFDIGESTIQARIRSEEWRTPMDEDDRRDLARLVWFAGQSHIAKDDETSRAGLKASSEWRLRETEPSFRWKPKGGAKQTINVNEIPNDNTELPADARFDSRDALERELLQILAEEGDEDDGDEDGSRATETQDGPARAEVAGEAADAADAGGAEGDRKDLAAAGQPGPASS